MSAPSRCCTATASSGVSQIAQGWSHELALNNGKVLAWGNDWYGQTEVPAAAQSNVIAISTSSMHSLALRQGGQVISWGTRTDVPAAAQSGVTAIAAGGDHNLVLKNGGVLAWGNNSYGQTSVPAAAQSGVTAISAGFQHSLALKNGGVIAWGRDNYHQAEVPDAALSDVVAIDAGYNHNLAFKRNGDIVAWGSDIVQESEPITCGPVLAVSAGDGSSFVIKENPGAPC